MSHTATEHNNFDSLNAHRMISVVSNPRTSPIMPLPAHHILVLLRRLKRLSILHVSCGASISFENHGSSGRRRQLHTPHLRRPRVWLLIRVACELRLMLRRLVRRGLQHLGGRHRRRLLLRDRVWVLDVHGGGRWPLRLSAVRCLLRRVVRRCLPCWRVRGQTPSRRRALLRSLVQRRLIRTADGGRCPGALVRNGSWILGVME